MKRIVLASASVRRQRLLEQLGLSFTTLPSWVKEDEPFHEDPGFFVSRMAYRKALSVAPRILDAIIIGADTAIFHQGQIIGKPKNGEEAFSILHSLSGAMHQVFTATVLLDSKTLKQEKILQETKVTFRSLTSLEIKEYILTGEPFDKAGAYAIQGRGASFVRSIEGCFYTVIGLPLGALIPALYKMGWKGRMVDEH